MKKSALFSVTLSLVFGTILFSCQGNPEQATNLKEPTVQEEGQATTVANTGENTTAATLSPAEAKALVAKNLVTAFTGETTASAKYAAYAKKAEEEGYHQIALLFKAASTSENIHAGNHRAVLEDMGTAVPAVTPQFSVKSTRENLEDAIAGETYEISTMYPEFLVNATSAGNQLALISLNYAYKTEQRHKPLYEKALTALQNNQEKTLAGVYYVCPTCGNTYDANAPKRCGISMTNGDRFIKVNQL